MVSKPDITVLLPFHNAARHLGEALESLQSQTFTGWTALLLDDGSTDDSPKIAVSAAAKDKRFEVVRLPRRGLVAALNEGLRRARAPLIARMDADDVSLPRRLELQRDWMRAHPNTDVLATRAAYHPDPPAGEGMLLYLDWSNALVSHAAMAREIFVESPIAHPTVMIRRSVLEDAGGYRDRGWPEDYDLWLRLWRAGRRFAKLRQPLLLWRDDPRRLSRSHAAYSQIGFRLCKLHHLLQTYLRDRDVVTVWGAGREGRWWGRELTTAGIRVRRFIDIDPKKIGRSIGGIPIVSPDALRRREPGDFILAAVGSRGARPLIRKALKDMGYEEIKDFIFLA